jgi:hypothetical protein
LCCGRPVVVAFSRVVVVDIIFEKHEQILRVNGGNMICIYGVTDRWCEFRDHSS